MPFDQFIVEQIAGDEIEQPDEQSVVATGFLRLGSWNDEPNTAADYVYDRLEDMVHTTSSAFLGLTVKCARCHNHKFDPILQEDYYRMASAFWSGPIHPRSSKLLGGPSTNELGYSRVLGWTDITVKPKPLHLLKNGERLHPRQEVVPASLSTIPSLQREFIQPSGAKTTRRRLQLARWIADARNPLTARVIVNRLWQHHFGQGIVRTPNNFGFLADPPTHPQLLDWLASEFLANGRSLKHIHRLILTSQTWQQSSTHPCRSGLQCSRFRQPPLVEVCAPPIGCRGHTRFDAGRFWRTGSQDRRSELQAHHQLRSTRGPVPQDAGVDCFRTGKAEATQPVPI